MNIEILTNLRDYPKQYPNDVDDQYENIDLSITEIEKLEQTCNNDNQNEMQEVERELMQFGGHVFNSPFYIVDSYEASSFLFVYLDEDQIDPAKYSYTGDALEHDRALDFPLGYTLSHLINLGVTAAKEGRSPM